MAKSKSLIIFTGLFLLLVGGVLWKVYPPLWQKYQASRATHQALQSELDREQQYSATIKVLEKHKDLLASLTASARQALPTTTEPDLLLLQLDGLASSLDMAAATLTVPFGAPAAAVATKKDATSDSGDPKPASQGGSTNSQPVVKSDGGQTTMVISGEYGYEQLKALLVALTTFSRWNKLTGFDITRAADKTTLTVSAQVFSRPNPAAVFSGQDAKFLEKARTTFGALKSYATAPNSATEGTYGRGDPFSGF